MIEAYEKLMKGDEKMGFDPAAIDATEGRHIGIQNVRERLEKQCGCTLALLRHPGEGTTVTVFIPTTERDEQGGDARSQCDYAQGQ